MTANIYIELYINYLLSKFVHPYLAAKTSLCETSEQLCCEGSIQEVQVRLHATREVTTATLTLISMTT